MVSDKDTPREEDCYQGESDFAFPVPPSTSPIVPAAVYECESTGQADALVGGWLNETGESGDETLRLR